LTPSFNARRSFSQQIKTRAIKQAFQRDFAPIVFYSFACLAEVQIMKVKIMKKLGATYAYFLLAAAS
jgi:hypothetical protein